MYFIMVPLRKKVLKYGTPKPSQMLLELSRLLLGRQHLPLQPSIEVKTPRGSIYITIMELGPQNHNGDGLLGANSIIVV